MSVIEDTLRHQLPPSQFNVPNPKTSSHYPHQYGNLPQVAASASPNAYIGGALDNRQEKDSSSAFDNDTPHFSSTTTGEGDDTVKAEIRSSSGTTAGGNRKLTLSRNRSPTGTSPATKSRKASAGKS